MYTEEQKTEAVLNCHNFEELIDVISKYAPFVSNSRSIPIEYDATELLTRLTNVRNSYPTYLITRANGLRDKVIELLNL